MLDFGYPIRPPWTRNWIDRLFVRLHITPRHMREWLAMEKRIKVLLTEVDERCITLKFAYSIEVDWTKKQITFTRLESSDRPNPIILSFDMLLGEYFEAKSFAEIGLFYRKR